MNYQLPFLLLFFTFVYNISFACSFKQEPFCVTLDKRVDDLVVAGIISAVDDDGINLEVLEVLRGEEDRTNIRIWDGTDFDCNGLFSMAAADLGNISDTIVIILPLIDSLENSWEVIGDYRRPDPYVTATSLFVQDGNVNGFIWGLLGGDENLFIFPYDKFVANFLETSDCSITLDAEEIFQLGNISVTNPMRDRISLHSTEKLRMANLYLVDLQGQVHLSAQVNQSYYWQENTDQLPSGVYFLRVQEANYPPRVFKLIKP